MNLRTRISFTGLRLNSATSGTIALLSTSSCSTAARHAATAPRRPACKTADGVGRVVMARPPRKFVFQV